MDTDGPSTAFPPRGNGSTLLHHTSPLLSFLLIVFRNRLLHASECLVVPAAQNTTALLMLRMTCPPLLVIYAASFHIRQVTKKSGIRRLFNPLLAGVWKDSDDQLTRLLPLVGDAGAAALVLLVVFSRPASLPTDALRTAAVTPSLIEGFLSVGLAGSCTSLPFWKRARRSCQLFVTLDIVVDESSSIDADDIVEILVR